MQNLKKQYYKLKLKNTSKNNVWRVDNELMYEEVKDPRESCKELLYKNIKINDKSELAEAFCDYFVNVASEPTRDLPKVKTVYNLRIRSRLNNFVPTTKAEVRKIINGPKLSCTIFVDGLSSKIIKYFVDNLVDPITKLVNLSMSQGVVPDEFKIAKVCAVFQTGNRSLPDNYRPISVVSAFSKILEAVVKNRLVNFLQEHNVLFKNQFGFRKNTGTLNAVVDVLFEIEKSRENKKGRGNFYRLKKGIDTVDHALLKFKMFQLGISGVALNWFCSYLEDRKLFVQIEDSASDLRTLNIGVPQGFILGPVLFLI